MSTDPNQSEVPAVSRAEPDSPHTAFIFVAVMVSVFGVGGVVVAVDQFFSLSIREEIANKVLPVENPALRQLRADEEGKLSRYQWADQKKGIVRVPLDRARELVLARWKDRSSGAVLAADQQATAGNPPGALEKKDATGAAKQSALPAESK